MTTFAQMQAQGVAFLKAQVGKGYTEVPGQNLGPDKWDCEGLARAVYLPFGVTLADLRLQEGNTLSLHLSERCHGIILSQQ